MAKAAVVDAGNLAMTKLETLRQLSFGAQVAEEETGELANYFVETDQWQRIHAGDIDVIRGDKGAGKSAIYSLLISRSDSFFDQNILLISAERARGATVFKDLTSDPPTSEIEFTSLWKLYLATLVAQKVQEFGLSGTEANALIAALSEHKLLDGQHDLGAIFRAVTRYAKRWFTPNVETTFSADAAGSPKFSMKITAGEEDAPGTLSVDRLLQLANAALAQAGRRVWVLLDRLDVAFAESHDLEANALRALFRVYRDLDSFEAISLKIFLRVDIWNRITESGFREASHITRFVTLEWSEPSLLNLIVRRILSNKHIVEELGLDRDHILQNFDEQKKLFYTVFAPQVEQGTRKRATFEWIVSRCADAHGKTAPREVIHLLTSLRETEIGRLERGEEPAPESQLFDRSVFKSALPKVSEARLVQNLYAEYPHLKVYLEKLRGERTEQTAENLRQLWSLDTSECGKLIDELITVGFFQRRGERESPTYWVPFLYRDALKLSQGLAEE
jgi:hypothetical protein